MNYKDFKATYKWIIKQTPDVTALYGIEGKVITMTVTTFEKCGARWVEIKKESEDITAEFYLNGVDAVPFFRNLGGRERLVKGYTKYGFIPVESHSTRPDGKIKIVRRYKFN